MGLKSSIFGGRRLAPDGQDGQTLEKMEKTGLFSGFGAKIGIFGHFWGFLDPKAANAPSSPIHSPVLSILSIFCLFSSGPIPDPDYLETLFGHFSKNIDFWGFLTFLPKISIFGSGPVPDPLFIVPITDWSIL